MVCVSVLHYFYGLFLISTLLLWFVPQIYTTVMVCISVVQCMYGLSLVYIISKCYVSILHCVWGFCLSSTLYARYLPHSQFCTTYSICLVCVSVLHHTYALSQFYTTVFVCLVSQIIMYDLRLMSTLFVRFVYQIYTILYVLCLNTICLLYWHSMIYSLRLMSEKWNIAFMLVLQIPHLCLSIDWSKTSVKSYLQCSCLAGTKETASNKYALHKYLSFRMESQKITAEVLFSIPGSSETFWVF